MIRLFILLLFASLCSAAVSNNYTTQIKWSNDYTFTIFPHLFHRIVSLSYDIKMINHSRFSYHTIKYNNPEHYITALSDEYNSLSELSTGKVNLSVEYKRGLTLVVRCLDKYSECIGNISIAVEQSFKDFGTLDILNLYIIESICVAIFLLTGVELMVYIEERFFGHR